MTSTLAARLLLSRRDLDMTQAELARRAGNVSAAYISDLERSKVENPTVDVIAALARALGVHPAYLIGWAEDPLGETPAAMGQEVDDLIEIYLGLPEARQRLISELLGQLAEV